MSTVWLIVTGCIYLAGIIVAAGDAIIDERVERAQARSETMRELHDMAIMRSAAARRRLYWAPLWPGILAVALWHVYLETSPRRKRWH